MSKFTSGQVPYPDYDAADVDNFNRKVEFTDDVFIYGQLYADIDSQDITFADDQSFTSITIDDNLFVTGLSTFIGSVDIDYLTVYQRHNVGASGTVFVAISSTSDLDGQTGGRVGIGSTQPDTRFQVGAGDTSFVVTDSGHGIQLEGQKNWRRRNSEGYLPAPPHDETGHTWHHSDSYLFNMTKYGIEKIIGKKYQNNMPAYDRILSDKEIIAVLSYIKSMWPKNIREKHNQLNARARGSNRGS